MHADETARRIGLLQGMAIFGGASAETLRLVLERADCVKVDAGGYFFREGDRGTNTYVLEEGRVAILKRWADHTKELCQLDTGDCFGEMALVDFGPRSASVRALEPCTALVLTGGILREIQGLDIEQFALIHMNMARELSRRLREAHGRLFEAQMAPDRGIPELGVPST